MVALRLCPQGAARTPLTSKPPLYTVLTATLGQDFHLTPNSVQLGPAARMGLVSLFHLPSHVFPPACCPDNLTQGLQHPAQLGHSLKPHRHSVRHARGNKQGDDFSGWLDWVRCNVKPRFHPPLFLLKADIEQKRRCPRGCSCAPFRSHLLLGKDTQWKSNTGLKLVSCFRGKACTTGAGNPIERRCIQL